MAGANNIILTKRLQVLFDLLSPCKLFADVGCDHGYIAAAMLQSGKAEKVIASDISAGSLEKAKKLLSSEIGKRAETIVSDGLEKLPPCDEVLIAGMGGEEICAILSAAPFLPVRLVLQPMKNADKVRKRALLMGYRFICDRTIEDGKFYTVMSLERGEDSYTGDELYFGRDNLKDPSEDFIKYAASEKNKLEDILKNCNIPRDKAEDIKRIIKIYGGFKK